MVMRLKGFRRILSLLLATTFLSFGIFSDAHAQSSSGKTPYREMFAGQWYTVYPNIEQTYRGSDVKSAPSLAQVLGPGRQACLNKYGVIYDHYWYKITFDQHLLAGRTSQIGFVRNVRCSVHSTGGTGGGMGISPEAL